MSTGDSDPVLEIIISVVSGIVLGVLLYSLYRPPVLYKGPNSREFLDRTFEYKNKTYRLDARVCACPIRIKKTD